MSNNTLELTLAYAKRKQPQSWYIVLDTTHTYIIGRLKTNDVRIENGVIRPEKIPEGESMSQCQDCRLWFRKQDISLMPQIPNSFNFCPACWNKMYIVTMQKMRKCNAIES